MTVYASAPLCAGAKQELTRKDGRAGDVRVQVICLDATGDADKLNLAAIGDNARRATEDSSTVGYITEPDPTLASFSRAILDAAEIAQISTSSGTTAMARLLRAIRQAGGDRDLRQLVYEALG